MSNLTVNNRGATVANKTENGTPIIEAGKENNKEIFLKMLVAQMKNQDPFNPQDPTQYVTQLAQFNQLEQSMTLNDNMENLIGMTNGLLVNSAMGSASNLIGKHIEAYDVAESKDDIENDKEENAKIKIITGVVESIHIKDGIVYMDLKNDKTGEVVPVEFGALIKVSGKNINIENKGE